MGQEGISRRAFLSAALGACSVMAFPTLGYSEPTPRVRHEASGEMTYGSSHGYSYEGKVDLVVDTSYGAWASTYFKCNIACIEGSIQFNSYIMYGTEYVETTSFTNPYETDTMTYHIEHQGTDNMGGGVLAGTTALIRGVGSLIYDQAVVPNPYAKDSSDSLSTNNAPEASELFVPAIGVHGLHGLVKREDLEIPKFQDSAECLEFYSLNLGTKLVELFDYDGFTVIDEYPVSYRFVE